jgi:hypothetical protein
MPIAMQHTAAPNFSMRKQAKNSSQRTASRFKSVFPNRNNCYPEAIFWVILLKLFLVI